MDWTVFPHREHIIRICQDVAWQKQTARDDSPMTPLAELRGEAGTSTLVGYDFSTSFESLANRGDVDCFIVSTEDGFSPLGSARRFFSRDLSIGERQLSALADWNRFENQDVSLGVLTPQGVRGKLRGVILAPNETSRWYEKFTVPRYGRPFRDFYYNVTFASIAAAARQLNAKRLAMYHLSGCGRFQEDIATCVAEALGHFSDLQDEPRLDSFMFAGCCIQPSHLRGIERLNAEGRLTRHRPSPTTRSMKDGFEVISLDIGHRARP